MRDRSGEQYEFAIESEPRIDLHLHSNCSDGLLTPAEVMEAARARGLSAVALTDHDTVAGLGEAGAAAERLGLDFVPGLELSAYDETGTTHLLGYFIDSTSAELLAFLETARTSRVNRAAQIVEKLNRLGVDLALEAVLGQAEPAGLVARPHVARALVAGGWVKDHNEAFDRYIGAGQPAYVPTRPVTPREGIRLIHAAGGVTVLAHGGKSHDEPAIRRLVAAGLDGLETIHPDHGPVDVRRLRKLAADLGLLETGGSDWHGLPPGGHGRLGSEPVPYDWYLRLKEAALARVDGPDHLGELLGSEG